MSETPQNSKPRKRKRHFLRFSLRALLLFTAVIAVWLGIISNRANRQRRAVEAISEAGGQLYYDYQRTMIEDPESKEATVGYSVQAEVPGPEWLRAVVGDHYFITPLYLSLKQQAVIDQDRLSYLGDLPEIEALSVYDVTLRKEDLAHFLRLPRLRSVIFGPKTLSSIEGSHDFEFLARCRDLQDLTLEGPCFGDAAAASLGQATDARQLYLHYTAIGDAGLAHFKGMSHLSALGLNGTRVTDAGLAHLQPLLRDRDLSHFRNLSKLRYLHFHDGTLDRIEQADSFAFLSKCPELDDLCLSGRGFGDEAAVHLRELTRLRRLFLSDTAIGDDALVHLTGMTELDVLRLENTNVGDAGLAHLEPLKNLSMLSLHSTQVTDGGLEHLKKLPSLWGVQAADTQVTPKSLKAALPHCETLSGW